MKISREQFCHYSHNIEKLPLPLSINLYKKQPVYCHQLIKTKPGKRIILFAKWDEHEVVAKLFVHEKLAWAHFKRDVQGASRLISANICTALILHQGKTALPTKNDVVPILLFKRIMPATELSQFWTKATLEEERKVLLEKLMAVLAEHHKVGIEHRDPNFDNFLLSNEKLYTVDGSSVRKKLYKPLSKKASLLNIANLFKRLPPQYDELLLENSYKVYSQHRNWPINAYLFDSLCKYVLQERKKFLEEGWICIDNYLFKSSN